MRFFCTLPSNRNGCCRYWCRGICRHRIVYIEDTKEGSRDHLERNQSVGLINRKSEDIDRKLPGATEVTSGPILSTIPAPSWPRMTGKLVLPAPPRKKYRSEWQTPEETILIRTSSRSGGATWIVSIRTGSLTDQATAALQLITCVNHFNINIESLDDVNRISFQCSRILGGSSPKLEE